jgi:hypothetical protein
MQNYTINICALFLNSCLKSSGSTAAKKQRVSLSKQKAPRENLDAQRVEKVKL